MHEVVGPPPVHDQLAGVRLAVETPERHMDHAELAEGNRAAAMPETPVMSALVAASSRSTDASNGGCVPARPGAAVTATTAIVAIPR